MALACFSSSSASSSSVSSSQVMESVFELTAMTCRGPPSTAGWYLVKAPPILPKGALLGAANNGRWQDTEIPCLDAYTDQRRVAFRTAIETLMDSLKLDAIVYPSWNHPPARIKHFEEEYKGDNNQVISPHTGQPAFTVPMGYTKDHLPIGLQFLGRMYAEPVLIRLVYAYEQGTKHRIAPELDQ